MSKAVMRLEKSKDAKDMARRERHNIRSVEASTSDKEGLVIVKGIKGVAKHVNALEKQMNAQLKAQGKRAIRKDAVKLIEVIMSSDEEFFNKYDYNQYMSDCEEFLNGFWGEGNIIQSAIHLDESTPHGHYLITPIKDNKFNYSAFINGRDDLSNYQEQLEKFMLSKGYEIEHRDLAAVTRKKHQTTRDWSKKMQKAEEMVDLMDQKTLRDTAIDGLVNANETVRLTEQLKALTEANIELNQQTQDAVNGREHWKEKYTNLATGVAIRAKDKSAVAALENFGYSQRRQQALEQQQKQNNHFRDKKMLDNSEDMER